MSSYSKQLEKQTPTRFWVNNPTPQEARKALEIGNVVCVASNSNYAQRMIKMEETHDEAIAVIDDLIKKHSNDHLIVALLAQHFIKQCCSIFQPLFENSNGELGWVALQGNPFYDEDHHFLMEEAERFYGVAKNIRVKFPATIAALAALEKQTKKGRATLATCGFSLPYARDAINAYLCGSKASNIPPPTLYVTALAGPMAEGLENYVEANGIDIASEVLKLAGTEFAKKQYSMGQQDYRDKNIRMIGGCRIPEHFTEMVAGKMHVTVNFDFIERLNSINPPVNERITKPVSDKILKMLCDKLPPFRYSIENDTSIYPHWSLHPSALYFRNYVRNGWYFAMTTVRERRILHS